MESEVCSVSLSSLWAGSLMVELELERDVREDVVGPGDTVDWRRFAGGSTSGVSLRLVIRLDTEEWERTGSGLDARYLSLTTTVGQSSLFHIFVHFCIQIS
jgi:hypothetical protein